jgi:myo-inositol 2-dehydrogenase / D-chiro-inositol 1-dehydrogenase
MESIRVAILGAGRMGALHAANIATRVPGATLAVVADPDAGGSAQRCAEPLGARHTRDVDSIFTDPKVDAVVISTPTPTHVGMILAAAQGKKHVFCEKPVSTHVSKIAEVTAAVAATGVQLQIGFNRRFDPSHREARRRVATGELGTPVLLTTMHCDAQLPPLAYLKTSGGIFHDMMIHDFDVARWLVGQDVVEVMAQGTCALDPAIAAIPDADTAVVTLRFEGGAFGVVRACRNHPTGHDVRAELLCSAGAVAVDNPRKTAVNVATSAGVLTDRYTGSFLERFADAYVEEMRAFVDALRHNRPVEVGGGDAAAALALADAAADSFKKGVPVKVSALRG